MAESEEWKTAFRIKYGFFEISIMNFGLCGALSSFQKYINDIMHEHLYTFCSAYIDDIFIYSKSKKKTRETHPINIPEVSKNWPTTGYK